MMHVRSSLLCFLLFGVCLGSQYFYDDSKSVSDLLPRSLWAEQLSLSLLSPYSLSPDVNSSICVQLLHEFANNSADLSNCLASEAWPVRLCQNCYDEYLQLKGTMNKIGNPLKNSTISCATVLLQSDRVQVIVALNGFFDDLWSNSKCTNCLQKNSTEIQNSTIEFMNLFDSLIQCFNKTKQDPPTLMVTGNVSAVCLNCNDSYRRLSDLYTALDEKNALCIDLEDAMNSTRRLWSKTFNCTLPCTDTVPVIAVSAFIMFLPVVFYLSTFLHSEQKKRKLILPKRLKATASGSSIQDKSN